MRFAETEFDEPVRQESKKDFEPGVGRRRRGIGVTMLCLCLSLSVASHAQDVAARFSGSGPQSTASFNVEGPWLLNWRVGSDYPTTTYLEIHLYDAQTNRLAGIALRHTGVGSGQRLIREGGEYHIAVVGSGIDWAIEIEQAPEAVAELLRQNPDLTEVRLVAPDVGLSRDIVGQLRSWATQDGRSLVLETDDGRTISIGFYGDVVCPGLEDAHNIFFVTSSPRGALFNGIVLEDGTHCYFGGAARVN